MSAAFADVAGLIALVVVLFAWDRGGGGESPTARDAPPIEARTDLSPRSVFFGDTVTALVDVTLDRNRVDPDSVRVQADFSPWKPVANPERLRRDAETTTHLRMSFVLRCLTSACISTDETAVLLDKAIQTFGQARVTYKAPEGAVRSDRGSLQVPWPRLLIGARFSAKAAQSAGASGGWRADFESLPAVTYGVAPGLLFALLLAAGTVLASAAGAFAYLVRPRRVSPTNPRADGPPELVLTPLERALALLEDSARVNGAADQRRALELVAAALAERGDMKLALASRALAWSEPVPGVRETNGLAVRARSALGQELHELA
jgi:hypothetical protein